MTKEELLETINIERFYSRDLKSLLAYVYDLGYAQALADTGKRKPRDV